MVVTAVFEIPTTNLRYRGYDSSGSVDRPGSYAFRTIGSGAHATVTTYEGLRDGSVDELLVHTTDYYGAAQSEHYRSIEAGDLFEWRVADDCWVRYTVTAVKPDPAGSIPRKLLGVEWMTYAFSGCSGTIAADTDVRLDWGPLADLGGSSLTIPIRHGPYQIVPVSWSGDEEEPTWHESPGYSATNPVYTSDLERARLLPYWRDPALPSGWRLRRVESGDVSGPTYGYMAHYGTAEGETVTVQGYASNDRGHPEASS